MCKSVFVCSIVCKQSVLVPHPQTRFTFSLRKNSTKSWSWLPKMQPDSRWRRRLPTVTMIFHINFLLCLGYSSSIITIKILLHRVIDHK